MRAETRRITYFVLASGWEIALMALILPGNCCRKKERQLFRPMKELLCVGCGLLVATAGFCASPVFSDNFDSYTAGNLVGQGTWGQTGTSTATPIQVAGGKAVLGTSGQDAYSPLPGGPLTLADGQSFYIGMTLNVSSAQTGDYFLHWTPSVGNSSLFFDRVFVQSTTGGYLLGWMETSGTGATPTYGTGVLSFGTDYRVVVAYHDVAGPLNDTGAIYVNPFTDPVNESGNVAYLTKSWASASPETNTIAAINLRQGSATSAAALSVDDLNASLIFGDVTSFTQVVPEPTILSLLGSFGLVALYLSHGRK